MRWRWVVQTLDGTFSDVVRWKRRAKRIATEVAARAPRIDDRVFPGEDRRARYFEPIARVERVR